MLWVWPLCKNNLNEINYRNEKYNFNHPLLKLTYLDSALMLNICRSLVHTTVMGFSPNALHFRWTVSPFRTVADWNLTRKCAGTEDNFQSITSSIHDTAKQLEYFKERKLLLLSIKNFIGVNLLWALRSKVIISISKFLKLIVINITYNQYVNSFF